MAYMAEADIVTDQEKFLSATLIRRSYQKLVFSSLMTKIPMKEGAGRTAYFVRYKRMNVPVTALPDDGADPVASKFSVDGVNFSLDEWGDVIQVTKVAQLTAAHPVIQQALELLSDAAARVMDREIGIVLMAGTNVQYFDGTLASRGALTTSSKISTAVINRARLTMENAGAPPMGSGQYDSKQVDASGSKIFIPAYVAVAGTEVLADIQEPGTNFGTWAAVATYANAKALYNAEVGMWLGFRWVGTNFIPKFTILGNTTAAAALGANAGGITGLTTAANAAGGSLTSGSTYYWKVTRKDLLRGYEEAISIEHSTSPGGSNTRMTFTFPSTAGYVYNLYFGSSTGDANLLQFATTNIAASGVATVDAVPTTTVTPPPSNNTTGPVSSVYPVFIFADRGVAWVGFHGIKTHITPDVSSPTNALQRSRWMGYSFFGKAGILDQTRLLRIELASTY